MPRLLGITILALCLALPSAALAGPQRMVIATAGTAGALYPMGVAMAETINKHSQSLKASAEASAASLENIRNLASGEVEMGISQNEMAYFAYTGTGKYKGRPVANLRSLFGNLISWVQVFVPAGSKITSIAQLKGKRVGVGAPGSGGEQSARMILAYYGLSYKDFTAEFMGNVDMVSAMKDGSLDAFFITHPLRSAPLRDLSVSMKVRLLPIGDQAFYQAHPYYTKRLVPAKAYGELSASVPTATSRIVMYTTEGALSTRQVAGLLDILWANAKDWTKVHPAVKKYTTLKDALKGLAVPLHPGAVQYYESKGMKIPARLLID